MSSTSELDKLLNLRDQIALKNCETPSGKVLPHSADSLIHFNYAIAEIISAWNSNSYSLRGDELRARVSRHCQVEDADWDILLVSLSARFIGLKPNAARFLLYGLQKDDYLINYSPIEELWNTEPGQLWRNLTEQVTSIPLQRLRETQGEKDREWTFWLKTKFPSEGPFGSELNSEHRPSTHAPSADAHGEQVAQKQRVVLVPWSKRIIFAEPEVRADKNANAGAAFRFIELSEVRGNKWTRVEDAEGTEWWFDGEPSERNAGGSTLTYEDVRQFFSIDGHPGKIGFLLGDVHLVRGRGGFDGNAGEIVFADNKYGTIKIPTRSIREVEINRKDVSGVAVTITTESKTYHGEIGPNWADKSKSDWRSILIVDPCFVYFENDDQYIELDSVDRLKLAAIETPPFRVKSEGA